MNDSIHIVEIEIPSSLNEDPVLDEIKKEEDDEEYEVLILSGVGNVSKDCSNNELNEWNEYLLKWRKNTFHKKPRGIELLIRKGIPEALRCEVWQLLAGCNKNEQNIFKGPYVFKFSSSRTWNSKSLNQIQTGL